MQVTFGIDVSKSTSTVCELIGESKNELTITNNRPGFIQLLHELTAFSKHPQIILKLPVFIHADCRLFLKTTAMNMLLLIRLKPKKR